eukprot:TRINITY_DN9920_c1_g1_i4.p1 TRINITY_DN9920_c1_g1~~TRINITY_DN9920_c1_g1_i4.p1  ORF type:complete len:744 (+),score=102.17 TRINITY_DN9920_c1_g1_i4:230-2461(+)
MGEGYRPVCSNAGKPDHGEVPELTSEAECALGQQDQCTFCKLLAGRRMLLGAATIGTAIVLIVSAKWHLRQAPRHEATKLLGHANNDASISLAESSAKIQHYYMYRVQNDEEYSPENQNMANVAGALWYLHNEIIWHHWSRKGTYASTPKTRIERFLVFSKATPELFAKGMNFGVVNTYDLGECTGPFKCENLQEYGPAVGCETWTKPASGRRGNNFPHQQWVGQNKYPNATWYSLPGRCSSRKFWNQTGDCQNMEPSGKCPAGVVPTGDWTCTYTYQKVGEISINEMEGLDSFNTFVQQGGREYDKATDKGINMDFWNKMNDTDACQARIESVNKLFQTKYPKQPILEDPTCDFDATVFYPYWPQGHFTTTTTTNTSTTVSTSKDNRRHRAKKQAGHAGKGQHSGEDDHLRSKQDRSEYVHHASQGALDRDVEGRHRSSRRGSFLVVGDWGYDSRVHENVDSRCQKTLADEMLVKMEELGDVQFVINVGDSFYPNGVESSEDEQWDTKWRNIYDKKLRSIPWYSVYGNHDYHADPCACTQEPNACAQVNYDLNNRDRFFMPGFNWFIEHPELNAEVVALDLNHWMGGWNKSAKAHNQRFEDCTYTSCPQACRLNIEARAKEAFELFEERAAKSKAKNMLVFSHYPTDYFEAAPNFLDGLRDNSAHDILYFGGHRHNTDQDSTISTSPNQNWLVGGGGGWSCDGTKQGFVVGEIKIDYTVHTYAVLANYSRCCSGAPLQHSYS